LIAPFGGFFASGVKRAFKIKDFSDSIPGTTNRLGYSNILLQCRSRRLDRSHGLPIYNGCLCEYVLSLLHCYKRS
jgi:hypothetical protein